MNISENQLGQKMDNCKFLMEKKYFQKILRTTHNVQPTTKYIGGEKRAERKNSQ